jgi:hypothetical protein
LPALVCRYGREKLINGSQKFAVMLCKFSDTATIEPQPVEFFRDLFVTNGSGGLNDYWRDASLGAINLDGTEVLGWKTLNQSRQEYIDARTDRNSKIEGAVQAFGIVRADYAGVVAIFDVGVGDGGASGGGVLVGPDDYNVTFLAHETGHVFGLAHSYDQSSRKDIWWSAPGEYFDQHDIMSAMNVHSHEHPRFGASGPLLCAPNLDIMGWLPPSRVWREPTRGSFAESFDLVPLGHVESAGYLAGLVGGHYVELRVADRWDAGVPRAAVLIHSLVGNNAIVIASDRDNFVNDFLPGQSQGPSQLQMVSEGGVRITVTSIDASAARARISVVRQAAKVESNEFFGSVVITDGVILFKDVVIRIPPKGGPLRSLLERSLGLTSGEVRQHGPGLDVSVAEDLEIVGRFVNLLNRSRQQ